MTAKFKILIGYDGSEYADSALDDLTRAGLPSKAEVFVATISEMWIRMPLSYGGVETSFADESVTGRKQAREIAAEGAEKLKLSFPEWEIQSDGAVGSPSEILLTKADEWKPDLIVVGSQSRGSLGRFFLGSVAQSLVHNALCSVRIARQTAESAGAEDKPARLIVGVDGSYGAESVVDSIIKRNWAAGCEVYLVSAMDYVIPLKRFDLPSTRAHSAFYYEEYRKAEKNVEQALSKFERVGFKTVSVIKDQDPIHLLIDEAKKRSADCIFVGAKGKSRIERLLIGSVSSSIAVRAHCSVEVVRP